MKAHPEQISPELALIDPELAAFARLRLAEPGDCLTPRAEPGIRPAETRRGGTAPTGARKRPRSARPSTFVVAGALLAAGLVGPPTLGWLPFSDNKGHALAPQAPFAPAVPAQAGGPATGPHERATGTELLWRADPRAASYELVAARPGSPLVTIRLTANHIRTRAVSGSDGRRLAPGSYAWYVVPVAEGGKAARGKVLASGVFTVER